MNQNTNNVDVLAVMDADARAVAFLADTAPSLILQESWAEHLPRHDEARAAVAELIAQRDAMANALRKLDLIVLPAAIKYRSIGPGDIEEAQEIVRAALARVGGGK